MKTNSIITASLVLAIAGMGSSCSSNEDKKSIARERDQDSTLHTANTSQDASNERDAFYSVVEFDSGSENLNESNKQSIRSFIENAKKTGKEFDDIKIMAWADNEYPAKGMTADRKDVSSASE